MAVLLSPRVPANLVVLEPWRTAPPDDAPLPPAVATIWLIGTLDEMVEQIAAYERVGGRHLMRWFVDLPSLDGLRLFAEEVMPRWRR